MLFADIIKELRKKKQIVNRKFDTTLEIENPIHHKIELSELRAQTKTSCCPCQNVQTIYPFGFPTRILK